MHVTTRSIDSNKEHVVKKELSIKNAIHKNIIFLLTVKASVTYVNSKSTLRQALEKLRYHAYTALPVVADDGTYIGTVSEGDFLWKILNSEEYSILSQENFLVSDIIRQGWNPPVKISTPIDELFLRAKEQNFVPVVDDREKFMGIITRKSVIRFFYELFEQEAPIETKMSQE